MTSAKKFLAVAIVAMFVASGFIVVAGNDLVADDNDDYCVEIVGTTYKFSGQWALHQALSGTPENGTVRLLKSFTGGAVDIRPNDDASGYKVNQDDAGTYQAVNNGITIDFNNFTYTVDTTVGASSVTKTQLFRVEGSTYGLTVKNGTIKASDDNENAKMLFQNYCNKLTFDNVVLDGSNLHQGYVAATEVYTNVYTLSNNSGNVTIKDSTIIECKRELQDNKSAFAFDVCANTGTVTLKGDNIIDGSIEFSLTNTLPTVVIDGTTTMTSGKISKYSSTCTEPMVDLEEDSAFLFENGVKITELLINSTFRFTNIIAGDGGMGIKNGAFESNLKGLTLFGNMTTDTTGLVLIVHDSGQRTVTFGIGGVIGSGVTAQFNQDEAVIVGTLRISEGATWKIDEDPVGLTDESFIVVEEGASYNGKTVTENKSYRVDTTGKVTEVFVVLFETTDHVESITYKGSSFIYSESQEGVYVDLSKIEVSLESGYKVTGFMVGGVEYGIHDSVTITTTGTVITAIVEAGEPEPEPSGADGMLPLIGAILVAFVALVFLIIVFYKKN